MYLVDANYHFFFRFISSGLFLFTYQSTQFNLTGFFLVEFASACAGVRWTLSQVVTQRKESGWVHVVVSYSLVVSYVF